MSLRTFFMEDHLEAGRFRARFNLGESGSRPVTLGELLRGTGLSDAAAADQLLGLSLRDSPNWGRDDLRGLIAQLHPGSTVDDVLVTTGSSEALYLLFHQLRPRRTALAMPAFQLLYEVPRSVGSEILALPVRWDGGNRPFIDEREWLRVLEAGRPDCVVINHPHNPSGLVLPATFLAELVDRALALGATVVGDEHYRFLASEADWLGPTVYRPGAAVFATGSFIKCVGCPGLRIGWCVGPRAMLAAMQSYKNYTTHTVNPVSEWVALRLLADLGAPIWEDHRQNWRANRDVLGRFLQRSRRFAGAAPSGGLVTTVAWREPGDPAPARLDALARAGVFVLPIAAMEADTLPHLADTPLGRGLGFRLGLGAPSHSFAQALDHMEQVT